MEGYWRDENQVVFWYVLSGWLAGWLSVWLSGCLAEVGVRSLDDLFSYLKKGKSFT